jgi:hypothetical protein
MRCSFSICPLHGLVALPLDPVHHTPRTRIEGLAMVHFIVVVSA